MTILFFLKPHYSSDLFALDAAQEAGKRVRKKTLAEITAIEYEKQLKKRLHEEEVTLEAIFHFDLL